MSAWNFATPLSSSPWDMLYVHTSQSDSSSSLAWISRNVPPSPSRPWPPSLSSPPPLQTHLEVLPESHPPSPAAFPTPPLTMETEPDQKDIDPLIPSAQTAAEEPEASTHGDLIDEDVVDGSKEADKALPFNMIRFLQGALADRAAQASATEQLLDYPVNWASMSKRQRKFWTKHRSEQTPEA